MQQTSEKLNNERLINWFVDYCQRKCGPAETGQARSLPLIAENTQPSNLYRVSPLAVDGESRGKKR